MNQLLEGSSLKSDPSSPPVKIRNSAWDDDREEEGGPPLNVVASETSRDSADKDQTTVDTSAKTEYLEETTAAPEELNSGGKSYAQATVASTAALKLSQRIKKETNEIRQKRD